MGAETTQLSTKSLPNVPTMSFILSATLLPPSSVCGFWLEEALVGNEATLPSPYSCRVFSRSSKQKEDSADIEAAPFLCSLYQASNNPKVSLGACRKFCLAQMR